MTGIAGLVADWNFAPSAAPLRARLLRARARIIARRRFPASATITPVTPRPAWAIYFIWLPDGRLTDHHRFTLAALERYGCARLVVCAALDPADVPPELSATCEALIWKALSGFDFSAYALGLAAIAAGSPGADVLTLNDSLYGPLANPLPKLRERQWDLAGFTATANVENHIQSYAFFMREVTPERVAALAPAVTTRFAYDRFWDVVLAQETRLAAIAARAMRVGALWYAPSDGAPDPMLQRPIELLDTGFPFLKRSLTRGGKLEALYPPKVVEAALIRAGYPIPTESS